MRWFVLWMLALCTSANASAGSDRILAFGDVHGAHDALVELLTANGIIDRDQNWSAQDATLVSLGDLVDRGPDSRKTLDLLMRLDAQAEAAGGEVVVLLGNHEAMNLIGDLRDVSAEEYAAFRGDPIPQGWIRPDGAPAGYVQHRAAFSASGRYGRWLLDRPAIAKRGNTVFAHGGLLPAAVAGGLDAANARVRHDLDSLMAQLPSKQPLPASLGDRSLLWHRGNAGCHELLEIDGLNQALDAIGAQRVVIGHTPTASRQIETRMDGRVIALDTGMLASVYRGSAMLLELKDDQVRAFDATGKQVVVRQRAATPVGSADEEQRWYQELADSELVSDEAGIASVTLAGRTLSAEFVRASERDVKRAVAAWRVDRQLGLNLQPLTVPVSAGGRLGYASITEGGWFDEAERQELGVRLPNYCADGHVYDLVTISDALLRRTARSAQELEYSNPLGRLRLTGQHRTFGTRRELTNAALPSLPQTLRSRLADWTEESLTDDIGGLVSRREIRALLARRDALLEAVDLAASTDSP